MTIYETELPGVGHKFELELDGTERLIVLIHHDGKREVYLRSAEGEDSEKLFSLTGKLARQLGSILEGAYFQPVEIDDVQVPLGETIIEWVEIDADASLIGHSFRDAKVREETGVSVIAVQRGGETISNPNPSFTVEAGDILVALGDREQQQAFSTLAKTGPTDGSP